MKTIDEVRDFLLLDLRNQERELFDISDYYIENYVEQQDWDYTDVNDINDIDEVKNIFEYLSDFNNVNYVSVDDCVVTICYLDDTEIEYVDTDDLSITRIEGYMIYIENLLRKIEQN